MPKFDELISKIDFRPMMKAIPAKMIRGLPDSEKERLSIWITAVREVKASSDDDKTKRHRLEKLPMPALIGHLIKNHIASQVESKSISSKETARTVLDTATTLTRFVGKRTFLALTAAGFGLHKLLPRLILSAKFDSILGGIEAALKKD
jgi:hypothetical protein